MSTDGRKSPIVELDELVAAIAEAAQELSPRKRAAIKKRLDDVVERLRATSRRLDPIELPSRFFDPSDPRLMGRFIGLALAALRDTLLPKLISGELRVEDAEMLG